MLHKEDGDKKTKFVNNNNKPSKVDKKGHNTLNVNPKTSAYDRVVQLVTNDNAEPVSQQQGPEPKKKYILLFKYVYFFCFLVHALF